MVFTYLKEIHTIAEGDLHLTCSLPTDVLPATCDGKDQGRSCNKLTDFNLHRLDPQSFFLALSVWVLCFFSSSSSSSPFFSVVGCESLAGSHKFKQISYIVTWGLVLQLNKKRKKKKKKDIWVNINNYNIHDTQKKKKMGLKKKNHDITQGNNENKRGVVRTMQTKVKESTA